MPIYPLIEKFKFEMGGIQLMNLRNLDLNLLRVFDTVYSTRSNTQAANTLGLTQSAVSNALRRLRDHLSDPLFVRQGQDFLPTAEADRLAPVVRDILSSLERTIGGMADDFDPQTSRRTFSLLMPDAVETRVLPKLINDIQNQKLTIKLRTGPIFGQDMKEVLSTGNVDVAILPHPVHEAGLSSTYLMDEEACMIARADHPVFGNRDSFTFQDLATTGLVGLEETIRRMTNLEQEVRVQKIQRDFICTVSRMWSIPPIVASTDLVGAVSKTMAQALAPTYGFKVFELPIRRPAHHWHLIWSDTMERDLGHGWLREQIFASFRQTE